jgi:regulator of protease activity HflC (stomatin/prohibitin superfamily)
MSLSGIFGLLALVAFVLFLAGIGGVVVASSQGRSARGGVLLATVGLVAGILFTIIGNGLLFVNVTEVAVITNTLTGQLEEPRRPGTSIIIPGLQVPTIYDTSQQEYTMSATDFEGVVRGDDAVDATTIDGQRVALDVTIFYSIDPTPEQINRFHTRWGNLERRANFIRSTGRTVVRDIVARFRAEAIYGEGRAALQEQINEDMEQALAEEGFILNRADVRGVAFSDTFIEAVEAAAAAEQRAVQARQEAERARTIAGGERDAAIARAQGEAQSIILRAQAEAESLRLVSEQIAANPSLIQYEYVRNLADNVSIALVPTNSPFLFDFSSLAAANPNLVVPGQQEQPELSPQPTTPPGS